MLPSLCRASGFRGRTAVRGPLRTACREVRDLAWLPRVFSRGQALLLGRLHTDPRQSDRNTCAPALPALVEIGDPSRGTRQFDDVQTGVGSVSEVHISAIVHLDVVGLNGDLTPLV